jgi:hypothetical protein
MLFRIARNAVLSLALVFLGAGSAQATPITVDQIIYQNAVGTTVDQSQLSGTIDVTSVGNILTVILTNTSADAAFVGGGKPGTMLLTGFGIQLGAVDILSGTVSVNGGSTALNFDVGQSATDISNQWLYANQVIDGYGNILGALTVDTVASSVANGQGTSFAGAINLNGPGYGAVSALETEFGLARPGVSDSIVLTLTLDGLAPDFGAIDAGNVVLAFGSPNAIPEPGAAMLIGLGLLGLGWGGRRVRQS